MVAKLIYAAITSLDGYMADAEGNFDWAVPSDEEHAFINELERPVGTYLYGRRMYELMIGWETDPSLAEGPPVMRDFAQIWQSADKIVYSRTLGRVSTARTWLEREFDPQAVRALKESAERDLAIGGPDLAAHAIRAGLVDEYHLYVVPIVIGAGKGCLPSDVRLELELLDTRRFDNGVVYLRYEAVAGPGDRGVI